MLNQSRRIYGFVFVVVLIFSCVISNNQLFPAVTASAAAKTEYAIQKQVYVGKMLKINDHMDTYDWSGYPTYKSSNPKIATVDKRGVVKAVSKGRATITLQYAMKKKKVLIIVKEPDGSTDPSYFIYVVKDDKITISGLEKPKATIVIPKDIDGYPVTSINAFAFCFNDTMKSVTFLGNIEKIGEGAFIGCSNLKKVVLCNSVKTIHESAFANCKNLTTLTLSNSLESIGKEAFSDCTKLNKANMPKSLKTIGQEAFRNCTSLTKIVIPDKVKEIPERAFNGCENLNEVTIGKGVKKIGADAFLECINLAKVTLQKVEVIESYAFAICRQIEEIILPETVKEIGKEAFFGCENLKRINIPDSLTKLGNMAFYGCNSLKEIKVNNSIERTIGDYLFEGTDLYKKHIAYKNNITFHLSEEDKKDIQLLQDTLQAMDIKETDTDVEKIKKVHDWIILNTTYSLSKYKDYIKIECDEVDVVLKYHVAICASYSETFQAFMDLLEIECILVSSDKINHAWNMVHLEDGWYHIDVTWDDPGEEINEWLGYKYFLFDDKEAAISHPEWEMYFGEPPAANGTKYLNYIDKTLYFKYPGTDRQEIYHVK